MLSASSIEIIKNRCTNEKDAHFIVGKCEDLYDKIIVGICKGKKPFDDQSRQAVFLLIDVFIAHTISNNKENLSPEEKKAIQGLCDLVGDVLKNEIMNKD